jgi:hypothetical protein
MESTDRDLTLIRMGYTAALQDVYSEIIKATDIKKLGVDIDSKSVYAMEVSISQAFLNINEKFIEQTTLLYIKTNGNR